MWVHIMIQRKFYRLKVLRFQKKNSDYNYFYTGLAL